MINNVQKLHMTGLVNSTSLLVGMRVFRDACGLAYADKLSEFHRRSQMGRFGHQDAVGEQQFNESKHPIDAIRSAMASPGSGETKREVHLEDG